MILNNIRNCTRVKFFTIFMVCVLSNLVMGSYLKYYFFPFVAEIHNLHILPNVLINKYKYVKKFCLALSRIPLKS